MLHNIPIMPQHKAEKKLEDHTVVQLRHMAKKAHVTQTTSSGKTKNKAQLVASLKKHK